MSANAADPGQFLFPYSIPSIESVSLSLLRVINWRIDGDVRLNGSASDVGASAAASAHSGRAEQAEQDRNNDEACSDDGVFFGHQKVNAINGKP